MMRYEKTAEELRLYVDEFNGKYQWAVDAQKRWKEKEKRKKKRKPLGQSIPHMEASGESAVPDDPAEGNPWGAGMERPGWEETGKGEVRGPVSKGAVGSAVPLKHYRDFDPAVPYVSVETAMQAVNAIRDLQELEKSLPGYIVTYMDDDGHRRITGATTEHDARVLAETELQEQLEMLEEDAKLQEVIIDDGECRPYQPTPPEYINDDESRRSDAEAKGMLHVYRGDTHFIIYNELDEKTSRWDIFPTDGLWKLPDRKGDEMDGKET